MSSASFAQTRSHALQLETQTEALLTKFSAFATSPSSSPTAEELACEKRVETVLNKREEVLGVLSRIAESDISLPTTKLQQLQRHKETLTEQWRDFGRIRGAIQQERNRLNLLFSVRSDIEEHRRRTEIVNGGGDDSNGDNYMMQERQRVDNANSFADRLLSQAYETRDELSRQRNVLSSAGSKLGGALGAIPGLNVVISKINTRKKRDTLIIAGLIVACITILWLTS
ncbi:unnamed protein product [Kuraishia capsulata CBS 1993]|uniref:Golgi SNAP receptor complex member 1 n=1 Tax=Kuraishia capsulata CBS 1993 TaxID=1382522 RepID=W6MIR1_9ASCO|nr:uncharacterized protein KUCA_T00002351001 [Kuraishia capsulata CBS 1993]CDK26379.1 unnamed protein product [Kuraishia capsulata CBS 1993]